MNSIGPPCLEAFPILLLHQMFPVAGPQRKGATRRIRDDLLATLNTDYLTMLLRQDGGATAWDTPKTVLVRTSHGLANRIAYCTNLQKPAAENLAQTPEVSTGQVGQFEFALKR